MKKKKVAVLGHYSDGTGYGHSCEELIKCLAKSDLIDVIPIWNNLSDQTVPIDPEIKKLQDKVKSYNDIDALIQYTLPCYYVRNNNIPINIGMFCCETDQFKSSGWQYNCNMMDQIWVLNPDNYRACMKSGVTVPVHEINHPHDLSKYDNDIKPMNIGDPRDITCKFYCISEYASRKNIVGLLASYFTEFTANDNVCLILKTYISGISTDESRENLLNLISALKNDINKGKHNNFPPVVLITDWVNEEQIASIHKAGHCFVLPSKGEAWCVPLFDAIMYGNYVIGPDYGGPKKMLDSTTYSLIPTIAKHCINTSVDTPFKLYHASEYWYEPNHSILMSEMRRFYTRFMNKKINIGSNLLNIKKVKNKYDSNVVVGQLEELICTNHSG